MNVYQMVVRNVAAHVRSQTAEDREDPQRRLDVFEASRAIAIGFAKLHEDVLNDIVHVDLNT